MRPSPRPTWPDPLTLIADKSPETDSLITSGLSSVGLRRPDHPLTLELLRSIEGGIAAPSANKFGKTSPTSAAHVAEEFGDSVAILDGGPCRVGIESTVAGENQKRCRNLPTGIFHCTDAQRHSDQSWNPGGSPLFRSSGSSWTAQTSLHAEDPSRLSRYHSNGKEITSRWKSFWEKNFYCPAFWEQPEKVESASWELYQSLRSLDEKGFTYSLKN